LISFISMLLITIRWCQILINIIIRRNSLSHHTSLSFHMYSDKST
jgi:hypothetical protein